MRRRELNKRPLVVPVEENNPSSAIRFQSARGLLRWVTHCGPTGPPASDRVPETAGQHDDKDRRHRPETRGAELANQAEAINRKPIDLAPHAGTPDIYRARWLLPGNAGGSNALWANRKRRGSAVQRWLVRAGRPASSTNRSAASTTELPLKAAGLPAAGLVDAHSRIIRIPRPGPSVAVVRGPHHVKASRMLPPVAQSHTRFDGLWVAVEVDQRDDHAVGPTHQNALRASSGSLDSAGAVVAGRVVDRIVTAKSRRGAEGAGGAKTGCPCGQAVLSCRSARCVLCAVVRRA